MMTVRNLQARCGPQLPNTADTGGPGDWPFGA